MTTAYQAELYVHQDRARKNRHSLFTHTDKRQENMEVSYAKYAYDIFDNSSLLSYKITLIVLLTSGKSTNKFETFRNGSCEGELLFL